MSGAQPMSEASALAAANALGIAPLFNEKERGIWPQRIFRTTTWMLRPALQWAAFRRDAAFRSGVPVGGIPSRCGVPIRRIGHAE